MYRIYLLSVYIQYTAAAEVVKKTLCHFISLFTFGSFCLFTCDNHQQQKKTFPVKLTIVVLDRKLFSLITRWFLTSNCVNIDKTVYIQDCDISEPYLCMAGDSRELSVL